MNKEKDFYESRIDTIFAPESQWKHRTLRTVFDPFSHEWTSTTMEEKHEILTRILNAGEKLGLIIMEYQKRYNENGRNDISESVDSALVKLLEYSVSKGH